MYQEPFLKIGAKDSFKDKVIKFIKLPNKPRITKISKKEVVIMGDFETVNKVYTNEVNVLTEISQKKNIKVIKVRTNIDNRYLFKI